MGSQDLEGGTRFKGVLPGCNAGARAGAAAPLPIPAVVAGRLTSAGQLDAESLTCSPRRCRRRRNSPGGAARRWRLMAFWLEFSGQKCSGRASSRRHGGRSHEPGRDAALLRLSRRRFGAAVGAEFGRTVDSFFCDSFEFWPLNNACSGAPIRWAASKSSPATTGPVLPVICTTSAR